MPKKSRSKAPAPTVKWQSDPALGDFQSWLDSRGTPYEPNFGQDEHGFDIRETKLHPGTQADPSITHDPGDAPVPVELAGDEKMAAATIGDLVAQIEGMYGGGASRSQAMRNNQALIGPRKGPLINVPLTPPRSGPLITSVLPTMGGPLINVPTMRMPGHTLDSSAPAGLVPGARAVPRGPSVEDLVKLKAQLQAKAHNYSHLVA